VRGTDLTLGVLSAAAKAGTPVFFYGSRSETLETLRSNVCLRLPDLIVAGTEPSKFRAVSPYERNEIARRIEASGARIVFVGLGCPRQEKFACELRGRLPMPLVAVGAAFDYLAGGLPEPPVSLRRLGLEWAWRLAHEPRRLWRRYLTLNPVYVLAFILQASRLWRPSILSTPTALTEVDA
jgi:exopolysaccharide biosynthesis WecB/TagA/CpsF family protein